MLKINIEQVIKVIQESKSIAEVNEKIGYQRESTAGYRRIKNIIKEYRIDISHFTGQKWSKGTNILTNDKLGHKHKIEDIFIENSKVSRSHVKKLIIKNNLIPYICKRCKITEWQGEKLSLHLEHENGIRNDNRLENLTFLCPNCHSLTNSYCGRNVKSKLPKTEKEVLEAVIGSKNIREILMKLGLSDGPNYSRIKRILEKNNIQLQKPVIPIENTEKSVLKKKKRLYPCLICKKPAVNKYCSYTCNHLASQKTNRPTKEQLKELVFKFPMLTLAKQFGVTDNAVRKWCENENIEIPPMGYWTRRKFGYSHEESLISQKKIQKPAKRFTKEQVLEIKQLLKENNLSLREIGEKFNVCHQVIMEIRDNKTYKEFLNPSVTGMNTSIV